MATKTKSKTKPPARINLKTTRSERAELLVNARKYADGNLSAWIRHAGLKYRPAKGEKIVSSD